MNQTRTENKSVHKKNQNLSGHLYIQEGGLDESSPYMRKTHADKSSPRRIEYSPTNYRATKGRSPISIFQTI
jgi:hypothetical protein